MNYSLEQLLAFTTAYELKSFKDAAVKLNKHRTTIGQVITNLEDQWAVPLFTRTARSVQPTEQGTMLYHYAKKALEQARTLSEVADSLSYGSLVSIQVAYSSFIPPSMLLDIRLALLSSHPNLKVNFYAANKGEIKQGIKNGLIHIALVNVYEATLTHSIDSTFLGHLPLIPVASAKHSTARIPPDKSYSEMQASKQFVLKSLIDDDMKERVIISSNYEVIDQVELIIDFLSKGLGWSLLPRSVLGEKRAFENVTEIHVVESMNDTNVPFSLWTPYSVPLNPIKKIVIDTISEHFE